MFSKDIDQLIKYYEILEIKIGASKAEINQAFKRLALIHHPDKNPADEGKHFKLILDAKEALEKALEDKKENISLDFEFAAESAKQPKVSLRNNLVDLTRPLSDLFYNPIPVKDWTRCGFHIDKRTFPMRVIPFLPKKIVTFLSEVFEMIRKSESYYGEMVLSGEEDTFLANNEKLFLSRLIVNFLQLNKSKSNWHFDKRKQGFYLDDALIGKSQKNSYLDDVHGYHEFEALANLLETINQVYDIYSKISELALNKVISETRVKNDFILSFWKALDVSKKSLNPITIGNLEPLSVQIQDINKLKSAPIKISCKRLLELIPSIDQNHDGELTFPSVENVFGPVKMTLIERKTFWIAQYVSNIICDLTKARVYFCPTGANEFQGYTNPEQFNSEFAHLKSNPAMYESSYIKKINDYKTQLDNIAFNILTNTKFYELSKSYNTDTGFTSLNVDFVKKYYPFYAKQFFDHLKDFFKDNEEQRLQKLSEEPLEIKIVDIEHRTKLTDDGDRSLIAIDLKNCSAADLITGIHLFYRNLRRNRCDYPLFCDESKFDKLSSIFEENANSLIIDDLNYTLFLEFIFVTLMKVEALKNQPKELSLELFVPELIKKSCSTDFFVKLDSKSEPTEKISESGKRPRPEEYEKLAMEDQPAIKKMKLEESPKQPEISPEQLQKYKDIIAGLDSIGLYDHFRMPNQKMNFLHTTNLDVIETLETVFCIEDAHCDIKMHSKYLVINPEDCDSFLAKLALYHQRSCQP